MEAPHTQARDARGLEAWLARPRREAWLVAALVLLAFGLRVWHVLGSRASPLFDAPQMDALYHVEWARAWAQGEQFRPPPFFRAPLYPWLLGLLTRLFGEGLLLPRLVQAGLGAGGVLATWAIGRRAFDRSTGLLAGLLLATNWLMIFFDGELLLESLAVPLYLLAIWLSLGLSAAPTGRRALLAGLVWGLGVITRPNVLLLLPPLAIWLLRRGPGGRRAALFLTLGALAPVLPITLYNRIAGGDNVLVASQAGLNLWIGNNPASDGSTAIVPGTRADWWGGHLDAIAQAEAAEGRRLRPSEVSAHYGRRALAFARSQPGAFAALLLHKLRLFTWNAELGNNEEPRFLFERFSPLAPLRWIGFGLLAPLALIGLWLSRRGAGERFPLWGFLALYSLSVVVFFVNARFRMPIVPALCVYAGLALAAGLRCLQERRHAPLGLALAVAAPLAALSYAVPRAVLERGTSNGHLILATAAAEAQDWAGAERELQAALEITPDNWIARRGLGITQRALGQAQAAEASLRAALRLRPDDVDSLDALAELLLEQERFDEVIALARALDRAAPRSARGPYALGRALFGRQELSAAADAFRAALEREQQHFGAAYSLGVTCQALGQAELAAAAFERSLDAEPRGGEPFRIDAYLRSIALRRAAGQTALEQELVRRMRADFPDHPATRALRQPR